MSPAAGSPPAVTSRYTHTPASGPHRHDWTRSDPGRAAPAALHILHSRGAALHVFHPLSLYLSPPSQLSRWCSRPGSSSDVLLAPPWTRRAARICHDSGASLYFRSPEEMVPTTRDLCSLTAACPPPMP